MGFVGRSVELDTVREVLDAARIGRAGALVVRGEPGIGKSLLLDTVVGEAAVDMTVLRAVGTEDEQDLDYAALHQLLRPLLGRLDAVPPTQREALTRVFGHGGGGPADRFLVSLAVLGLFGAVADDRPVLVVGDDVQWFDSPTVEVLAFVARRLDAERLALLLAERDDAPAAHLLDPFPVLHLTGLPESDAFVLLASATDAVLDRAVASRLVELAAGNPLALRQFADLPVTAAVTPGRVAEISDGLLLGGPLPIGRRLEARFLARVRRLSPAAQHLLLVAAADTTADPDELRAASSRLLDVAELNAAEEELAGASDLVALGRTVRFAHPLIRSAVYEAAPPVARRRVHAALAAVLDSAASPERHARHLAGAADGPDDAVAARLVEVAAQARQRGAYLTAAALLGRAAGLTPPGPDGDARLLAAAQDAFAGGALHRSDALRRQAHHLDAHDGNRAWALRLEGLLLGFTDQAAALRLIADSAAGYARLGDTEAARACLVEAFDVVELHLAGPDPTVVDGLAELALELTADTSGADGLLLRGTGLYHRAGAVAAAPVLRAALNALRREVRTRAPSGRWYLIALLAAHELWDETALGELANRVTDLGHAGDARMLSIGLAGLAHHDVLIGDLAAADEHWAQYRDVYEALTGSPAFPTVDVLVHAWRGHRAHVEHVAASTGALPVDAPGGSVTQKTLAALVLARLADGDWPAALEVARHLYAADTPYGGTTVLPDLVEAAVRTGDDHTARAALDRLDERATAVDNAATRGLATRSAALLADANQAEPLYVTALDHLDGTRLSLERARTQLLYGEWLRRQRRRADARTQLHAAHRTFTNAGATAFAARTRAELVAAGAQPADHPSAFDDTRETLTAQEARVARLAATGATNQEIAVSLVVSPTTVDYHLRKVFRKLRITSRRQLRSLHLA